MIPVLSVNHAAKVALICYFPISNSKQFYDKYMSKI